MTTKKIKSIEKLLKLNQHKIILGLTRVKKVLKKLKLNKIYPDAKVLIIGGTSAKNSILQIFKSIIIKQKKNYAATYSPHLVSIIERFELNKKFINKNLLKKKLMNISKIKNLTQFEKLIITFADFIKGIKLDWILAEVGLFGRLDAIRALFSKPNIYIVSPISWDHLGWTKNKKRNYATLKEIVYEKTSFIRSKVYISKQTSDVLKLIKSNLNKNKNLKFFYGKDYKMIKKNGKYFYKDHKNKFEIKSNLIGDYMYENITVAIKVALDQNIPIKTIKLGIKKVDIPGRLQIIKKGRLRKGLKQKDILILDGAHNEQQSQALTNVLDGFHIKNKYAFISMINSKDPYSFLQPIKNKFKKIYFTNMDREKNVIKKEQLKLIADKLKINSEIIKNFNELKIKLKNQPRKLILCSGSLYHVGSLLSKN